MTDFLYEQPGSRFGRLAPLLNSASFERRREGSRELGHLVATSVKNGNAPILEDAIRTLTRDFIERVGSVNHRKGGLIGLAGCVIALGESGLLNALTEPILRLLLQPVIYCFRHDPEIRVYAAEALYNIVRVVQVSRPSLFV